MILPKYLYFRKINRQFKGVWNSKMTEEAAPVYTFIYDDQEIPYATLNNAPVSLKSSINPLNEKGTFPPVKLVKEHFDFLVSRLHYNHLNSAFLDEGNFIE